MPTAAYMREYNQRSGVREKRLARLKRYYYYNHERELQKHRESHQANRDRRLLVQRVYTRKWQRANPGKVAVNNARCRARKTSAEGGFTAEDWAAIRARQKGRCFDCGQESKLTVGHLIPLCCGGSNAVENLVGQCCHCNSRQGRNIHEKVVR
jgi:5-methylcytosine-specific restriction endonuclease McrA